MIPSLLLLSALSSCVCAISGPIPEDHTLWGPAGKPDALASSPVKRAAKSKTLTPVSQCTNGPLTRSCWANGYSVATDFDLKWPTTGVTRSYNFEITNSTCNPDGHGARTCMLVNGQYPGPTVTADWGDMVSVTVTNKMQNNGTNIHWHGIRQHNTNAMDGVAGLVQCPIPPGSSQTYTWQATQFGSTWWHSHFDAQYGDGVSGPLVIHGPASANYDIDLGPVVLTDWYYHTAWDVEDGWNMALDQGGPGPNPDTVLINGKNKAASGAGSYSSFTLTPGKKHLLRVVNTAVDNSLRFSIDNHPLQVITSDLVPVKPISVDSVMLAPGQRYMVIVEANQTSGNYWMRAHAEGACYCGNNGYGYAIVSYSGAKAGNPTSESTETDTGCTEPGPLVPWVVNTVGSVDQFKQQTQTLSVDIDAEGVTANGQNIVVWGINMTAIDVSWEIPTLSYVMSGGTNYPRSENLISLPNQGIWTYWIIQEVAGGQANIWHPMHLHGHDFYMLGSGQGTFNIQTDPQNLQYTNPTRRDTTMLPANGWLVLAWPTDNPGAWLFHCHIAWHVSEGLGVQFLESPNLINQPGSAYTNQCSNWSKYSQNMVYPKDTSGV